MDHFGLPEGDARLKEIAREIEEFSGEGALVFRYGGDEFGVILYESSLEKAREVAETIRARRVPVEIQTKPFPTVALTLSLGIAHFPTDAPSEKYLFWAAELALLRAKRMGQLPFGLTSSIGRNRVMAISDFRDDFPLQSAECLK
jgi:diguanylate cyclase (GGDEF)-like protein